MPDPIEIVLPLAGGCQCGACRHRVTRALLALHEARRSHRFWGGGLVDAASSGFGST